MALPGLAPGKGHRKATAIRNVWSPKTAHVWSLNTAHVWPLNTAHVWCLKTAHVLCLKKAHVLCLNNTCVVAQHNHVMCPKIMVLATNWVPVARHGPPMGHNEAYGLQEAFLNTSLASLSPFLDPKIRRRRKYKTCFPIYVSLVGVTLG